jgi:hypothetical protein
VIVTCVVLLVIGALVALPNPPVAAVETDLKTLTYFGISGGSSASGGPRGMIGAGWASCFGAPVRCPRADLRS